VDHQRRNCEQRRLKLERSFICEVPLVSISCFLHTAVSLMPSDNPKFSPSRSDIFARLGRAAIDLTGLIILPKREIGRLAVLAGFLR
jgi:hypothetical protein